MFIKADIHSYIKEIESNTIDCIYTNPPFGITQNKWDKSLDWDSLWIDIWRILKPKGVAIIHASMPFSYKLIKSQIPKYHYIWIKGGKPSNFFNAKKQPLRNQEEIYIFYKKPPTYNPQMVGTQKYFTGNAGKTTYYNPSKGNQDRKTFHIGMYPSNILNFKRCVRGGKTIPDEMIEFFVKTYTNEGDLILDMTCHNDVVFKVIDKLDRNYIGVDINLDDDLLID